MAEDFDPKKHGVGTMPVTVPEHVKELWEKHVKPLIETVEQLSDRVAVLENPPKPAKKEEAKVQ